MFVKESWYAAAWSDEVGATPLARTYLGEPVVLFRSSTGVAALADRCAHRRLPLSMGQVVGDAVQCPYHGFEFDGSGRCIRIPGQAALPSSVRVRAFPVVEKYALVWIWMGAPENADEADIPDYSPLSDANWRYKSDYIHVAASYRLIVENLLDLTHLAFVHKTTIGNAAVVEQADVKFDVGPDHVQVERWMVDAPPPPTYVKAAGFTGHVDRWQRIYFDAPSFVRLDTGATDTGTGAPQGDRVGGMRMWNLNLVTPETERTSHYLWAQCHDFRLDESNVTETVFNEVRTAFLEDKTIFEAQQRSIDIEPDAPEISVRGDTASIGARRIIDRLIAKERHPAT